MSNWLIPVGKDGTNSKTAPPGRTCCAKLRRATTPSSRCSSTCGAHACASSPFPEANSSTLPWRYGRVRSTTHRRYFTAVERSSRTSLGSSVSRHPQRGHAVAPGSSRTPAASPARCRQGSGQRPSRAGSRGRCGGLPWRGERSCSRSGQGITARLARRPPQRPDPCLPLRPKPDTKAISARAAASGCGPSSLTPNSR